MVDVLFFVLTAVAVAATLTALYAVDRSQAARNLRLCRFLSEEADLASQRLAAIREGSAARDDTALYLSKGEREVLAAVLSHVGGTGPYRAASDAVLAKLAAAGTDWVDWPGHVEGTVRVVE